MPLSDDTHANLVSMYMDNYGIDASNWSPEDHNLAAEFRRTHVDISAWKKIYNHAQMVLKTVSYGTALYKAAQAWLGSNPKPSPSKGKTPKHKIPSRTFTGFKRSRSGSTKAVMVGQRKWNKPATKRGQTGYRARSSSWKTYPRYGRRRSYRSKKRRYRRYY